MPFRPHARTAAYLAAFLLPAACLCAAGTAARADLASTTLHSFAGSPNDGAFAESSPVLGADGALYGTASYGGANNDGVIYKIDSSGNETVLHSFTDANGDGSSPETALVVASNGTLFGTTSLGGVTNEGTVFSIQPDGSGYTVLHSFAGADDGGMPYGALTLGADGRYYGTTNGDGQGTSPASGGTIYSLSADGTGYSIEYVFSDPSGDGTGQEPICTLTRQAGSTSTTLYGFTNYGGSKDEGTVFSFTPGPIPGTGSLQTLHNFNELNGEDENPYLGSLEVDSSGNIFGVNQAQDSDAPTVNNGVLYRLSPDANGDGGYALTVLHAFNDGSTANDGAYPEGGVLLGFDGNIYGTTEDGGSSGSGFGGGGTFYRIAPNGSNYAVVIDFGTSQSGANDPVSAPIEIAKEDFIGAAPYGGNASNGAVYEIVTPAAVNSVTVNPSTVVGGATNPAGAITLANPAPFEGLNVFLQSANNSVASVPAMVFVPGGSTSAPFSVTTAAVSSNNTISISAFANNVLQSTSLTVTPAPPPAVANLRTVTLGAASAQGPLVVTGNRVYVHGSTPANEVVTLTSSDPAAVAVPSSVIVQQGASSRLFNLTVSKTAPNETVTITASFNGQTQTAQIAVSPSTPTSITLKSIVANPSTVEGGTTTMTNRVYFTGNAAATTVVSLTSSNPAVASVPKSVTVQQGYSSHVFTITTQPVTSAQQVTLTATANGVTQTTYLTVTP